MKEDYVDPEVDFHTWEFAFKVLELSVITHIWFQQIVGMSVL